jgi:hypothetical protein
MKLPVQAGVASLSAMRSCGNTGSRQEQGEDSSSKGRIHRALKSLEWHNFTSTRGAQRNSVTALVPVMVQLNIVQLNIDLKATDT